MDFEQCPRCGVRRPDAFQWCRKCGLDFAKAERGQFPRDMSPTPGPLPRSGRQAPPPAEPTYWQPAPPHEQQPAIYTPVPLDRRTMARMSAASLDMSCLGTAGGCLGVAVGAFLGLGLGAALGLGLFSLIPAMLCAFLGAFAGMRVTLGLMGR